MIVIFVGFSEAGERYQNALPCPDLVMTGTKDLLMPQIKGDRQIMLIESLESRISITRCLLRDYRPKISLDYEGYTCIINAWSSPTFFST